MREARSDSAWKRLKARLRNGLTRGARDERGAAAIMFAVSLVLLIPLMLGVFEVYYGNEQRAKLQDSLDAAALFAARSTAITTADLTTIGRTALNANLTLETGAILKSATFVVDGQKVIATAQLQPASLMGSGSTLWRHPDITVTTEINRAMDKLEVALVLDNTGSMQGTKLSTLKTSAKSLVDKLVAASASSTETEPLKFSLVPFSNTVRVQTTTSLASYDATTHTGTGIPAWIDPMGKGHQISTVNYDNFSAANVDRLAVMKYLTSGGSQVQWEGCVEARHAPYDVDDTAPSAGTPATLYTPWFWPDEADNGPTTFKPTGSSTTYAGSYNDYINDIPAWSASFAYLKGDIVSYTPPTWSSTTTYTNGMLVTYSSTVYQAKNITGNTNKTPSSSTSYWATYANGNVWQAATASTGKTPGPSIEWVTNDGRGTKARQLNRAKYGATVSGVAQKNAGPSTGLDSTAYGAAASYVWGPNFGCALQPVIRLTTNASSVKTAIDAMTAVGETNIPIGLAWGWNALSPTGPFADGRAYGTDHNRKIVILMTDGENTMNDPSKSQEINGSFYGGYGYIWQNMLGITSGAASVRTDKIDDRLTLLCTNMKAKGIVIYTVRVEVTSGSSDLLQGCATTPDKFYDVQDVAQLGAAFDAIARSIDNLRISK